MKGTNDNDIREKVEYSAKGGNEEMSWEPESYSGIYRELAELLGDAAVMKIWREFAGSTVTFPMRLYSREHVRQFIRDNRENMRPAELGRRVGLSERRVRQIIHDMCRDENLQKDGPRPGSGPGPCGDPCRTHRPT